jgi:hypothetical protein
LYNGASQLLDKTPCYSENRKSEMTTMIQPRRAQAAPGGTPGVAGSKVASPSTGQRRKLASSFLEVSANKPLIGFERTEK